MIYADIFTNVKDYIYKPKLFLNENIINGIYYFYIPIKISKSCDLGQYYDTKKYNYIIIYLNIIEIVGFAYIVPPLNLKM